VSDDDFEALSVSQLGVGTGTACAGGGLFENMAIQAYNPEGLMCDMDAQLMHSFGAELGKVSEEKSADLKSIISAAV
jgi:hypothetical protein